MENDHKTMAQEDQSRNGNNGGGGGGRSSKKLKPKKVPQRGLGVAQLEKIRLEELHKKNAAAILSSQCSLESTRSSPLVSFPIQNFHHNSMINAAKVQGANTSTVPLGNSGVFEPNWPNFSNPRHGNLPQFDIEKDMFAVDPSRLQFPTTRLHFGSNPTWSLPPPPPPQYHHQSQPSLSLVNVSSGNSSISIEPPSNQNHSGNNRVHMRPEDTLVHAKRPRLFASDPPSMPPPMPPPVNYNMVVPSLIERRANASTSCGSGSGSPFSFHAGNTTLREVPSCSASNSEPNSGKNDILIGDFLKLAPPISKTSTSCAPTTPTSCQPPTPPLSFLAFLNQQNPGFETPSNQGVVEGRAPTPPGYNRLSFNEQNQPLFRFLPTAADEAQNGQTRVRSQNGNQVEEEVDLNLKL